MSAPVLSEMGYGQPVIYEAGGVRQLIIWHPRALNSLDPETGRVYGELPDLREPPCRRPEQPGDPPCVACRVGLPVTKGRIRLRRDSEAGVR